METILQEIYKGIGRFVPDLLFGIFIFALAFFSAKIANKIILKIGNRYESNKKQVIGLIASASKIAIIILGLITSLGTVGINISALVAGLGLTGFALGFALRDALSNLLAGVLILIYQPFRYGDRIAVAGCEGEVTEINLRYTVVAGSNEKYLIPNSTLFNNNIRISDKKV